MECLEVKGPERKVIGGRIGKMAPSNILANMRAYRKGQERVERLRKVTKRKFNKFTNVSKDMLDKYESIHGIADKFESPGFKPRLSIGIADTTVERLPISLIHTPRRRDENGVNGLDYIHSKTNHYTPVLKEKNSSTPYFSSRPSLASLKSPKDRNSIGIIEEPHPPLAMTIIQQSFYKYYNTVTFEQIDSFELLDPNKYNESNSWIRYKLIVNVPKLIQSRRVFEPQERLCWIYYNKRTGSQRKSFQKLEKTDEEIELCEHTMVPQVIENPEEYSIEAEFQKMQIHISEESEKLAEENREFATEKEIQEESRCLEKVEEMGVQAAIKHIKEENKNVDNLIKAYICRELSLKSPRCNGNVTSKKRSATRRFRDWVQCDGYPSMTLEQAEKLVVMLNSGDRVLVEGDKVSVRGNDLITLKKRGWLNDEVINFYIELILKRSASEPEKYPKIHMFNTFFYPLLEKKGYPGVARITKKAKVDIFSLDMVLVPLHLQIHWALAVINFKERRLEYYDSMNRGKSCNEPVLSLLKHYIEEEYKDKKKAPSYDMSEWEYYIIENLPQQTNSYDCGVFSMTFSEHISRGTSVLFRPPKYMKYFRLKMMWEIISSKLLPVDQQHQPYRDSEPMVRSNGNIINNHVNSFSQKITFENQEGAYN